MMEPTSAFIDFTLPIKAWEALLGVVLGVLLAEAFEVLRRPRVSRYGFIRIEYTRGGELIKFWFRLRGASNPGHSGLEITHQARDGRIISSLAKWDETAEPITRKDQAGRDDTFEFDHEKVPATYFQPLHLDRHYTVPILWVGALNSISGDQEIFMFCGGWFGPDGPRGSRRNLQLSGPGEVRLNLFGSGLRWTNRTNLRALLRVPMLRDASSHFDAQPSLEAALEATKWKRPRGGRMRPP